MVVELCRHIDVILLHLCFVFKQIIHQFNRPFESCFDCFSGSIFLPTRFLQHACICHFGITRMHVSAGMRSYRFGKPAIFPALPNRLHDEKPHFLPVNRASPLTSRRDIGYQGWPYLHVIAIRNLYIFLINTRSR